MHKLEADSIQLEFNLRRILSDVYIKCETNKVTGILGRNGQGKTCLMNVIYGELQAYSRSVRFDNVSVSKPFKCPDLLLYLPQFNFIPSSLSIGRILKDYDLFYDDLERMFPEFGMKHKTSIGDLSGGQRRLIEVYIIVKPSTQFCMLDEPFSHLMPLHIEKIKELIRVEKETKGFLITDHMYQHILDLSDNLYILKDGKTHLTKDVSDIERLGYARL